MTTYPGNVLTLAVDNLPVPQSIRNHSGGRGLVDCTVVLVGAATIAPIAATGAGTFGGRCFRFTTTGSGASNLIFARAAVTPGWKCEVAYKAAVVTGVAADISVALLFETAAGASVATVAIGAMDTDTTTVVTVPAGAVYAYVRTTFQRSSGTLAVNLSAVTLRQAATAGELTAGQPPESWLDVTGKTVTINAEYGNTLEGVEDILEPGTLVAVINDASVDPNTNPTIRRGRTYVIYATLAGTPVYVAEGKLEIVHADYADDGTTVVTLTGTDVARLLNDSSIDHIDDVLAIPGGMIQAVAQRVGAATYDGTSMPSAFGGPLLARGVDSVATWLKRVGNTLGMRTWVDNRNVLQQRTVAGLGTVAVATLSDSLSDTGAIFYSGITLSYGSDACINALESVTRYNADEVFDDGAKAYGPYVATSSERVNGRISAGLEIVSGSPSSYAATVLPIFAEPSNFPSEVRVNALHQANTLAAVLALQPYQPIRVKRLTFDKTVRLLRIRHEITATRWTVILTFRPLETATAGVVVNNPPLGADTGPVDVILRTKPLAARERTTTSTRATGVQTPINFDSPISSDGIPWDAANSQFTVPRSGRYDVTTSVEWVAAATGIRRAYLKVNGIQVKRNTVSASSADNVTNTIAWSGRLAAGDIVRVDAFHNAGSNRQIDVNETNVQIKYAD